MTLLPRTLKIDGLRIQIESFDCDLYRTILRLIPLPFVDSADTVDTVDTVEIVDSEEDMSDAAVTAKTIDVLVLNKLWHRVWEFPGSKIGAYTSFTPSVPSRFFVDLNGSCLAFLDISVVVDLISVCVQQYSFFCNRIDTALPDVMRYSSSN
jgi:hypothetical protein